MKNYFKIIILVSAILICGIASPCSANNLYYKTIQQPAAEAAAIKNATEFKVKPIDFSAIKPADLGYANADEWKTDIQPAPEAFADAFLQLAEEEKMLTANTSPARYKVIMLRNDEPVTSGILVTVAVKSIVQKWSYFGKDPDEFLCSITFTDASNNQVLYSGIINVTSKQATLHLGGSRGLVPVGPGMSFSGRVMAAVKNMALVLSTIMREGKIEPAEKKYYGIS